MGSHITEKQDDSRTKYIQRERNMFVAKRIIVELIKIHDKHPVSTDEGTWYPSYCNTLKLRHHLHSPFEKSHIDRTI
jgi:putative transposase